MSRGQTALLSSRGREPAPNRGAPTAHRRLRALAVAALALTFLLIAIGALVRATGSGEGCTGWPKCSAHRWLPPFQYHAVIEYSHRMTAFLDIVLVAALAVVAWRGYRRVPSVFVPAVAASGLIVLQAALGGIVVKGALPPLLVTAHFATAMVLAAVLVYVAVSAFTLEAVPADGPTGFTIFAMLIALAAFGLLGVGAYVRGENAGLVFGTWPLMNGRLVPHLSSTPAALQFLHRLLALVVGAGVGALAVWAWRQREAHRAAAVFAMVAAGLYAVQVMIGAALVWSGRAPPAIVAHVAVSSLVWGSLVATATVSRATSDGVAPPFRRVRSP
jgi:heme A synthase